MQWRILCRGGQVHVLLKLGLYCLIIEIKSGGAMLCVVKRLLAEEVGATAVEYGLLLALLALAILGAITALGTSLSAAFDNMAAVL